MAALVRGEDLPVREVQDVPYVVLAVGGEDTKCPICHLVFMTPYQLREHMDVHRGGAIPLWQLFQVCWLATAVLKAHQKGCSQGSKFICEGVWLGVGYKARIETTYKGSLMVLNSLQPDEVFICPFCAKQFGVKKSMREHITTCSQNPAKKGPFFCHRGGV